MQTIEEQIEDTVKMSKQTVEELEEAEKTATKIRKRKFWTVVYVITGIVLTIGIATPFLITKIR